MAKVLIICARRYNGHELWTLLKRLQLRGHSFEVVSTDLLIRDELTMEPSSLDRLVYDVKTSASTISEFDAVAVVSGNMSDTEAYWDDLHVQALLKAFKAANKVVAAICCSVPTLSVVAKGAIVSPFPLVRNKHRLLRAGALLSDVSVCVDIEHRIITAENQMMTYTWGECMADMLEGKKSILNFTPNKHAKSLTGLTPRKLPSDIEEVAKIFRPTPEMINKPK